MLKMRSSTQTISIFILLALAGFCANADFIINKENASGTAQVSKKELIFDKIDLGNYEDYKSEADAKKFTLEIGDCKVKLIAFQGESSEIKYRLVHGGTVIDLKEIKATEGKRIKFIGTDNNSVTAKCSAKFESTDDGNYKVDVKLSGEDVPSVLVLKSTSASDYKEPARSFSVVTSILLGVGCFLLIAFLIGFLIVCLVCQYEKSLTD